MPDPRTRLRVFVASPSDTSKERDRLGRVVAELNTTIADEFGLVLELVKWETHSWPSLGEDPQDVINRQIGIPDIFIGILWTRLGTPTGRAPSGTIEEYERALAAWEDGRRVEFMFYFNDAPCPPHAVVPEQLRMVQEFRRQLEQRALVSSFRGTADFETKVRTHLIQVIRTWRDVRPAVKAARSRAKKKTPAQNRRESTWKSSLRSGQLRLALRGGVGRDSQALLSDVRDVMEELGYRQDTAERVEVCFTELLENAAHHAGGMATVKIEIHTQDPRTVVLSFADNGPGFVLEHAIKKQLDDVELGKREHGLLLVARLAGKLVRFDEAGVHETVCEIHEPSLPDSPIFGHESISPVQVCLSGPAYGIWIGDLFYSRDAFRYLSGSNLASQYFRSLDVSGRWLGVEFVGGTWMASVAMSDDHATPEQTAMRAVSRFFASHFRARRVIVKADRAGGLLTQLETWSRDNGLFFCSDLASFDRAVMNANVVPRRWFGLVRR